MDPGGLASPAALFAFQKGTKGAIGGAFSRSVCGSEGAVSAKRAQENVHCDGVDSILFPVFFGVGGSRGFLGGLAYRRCLLGWKHAR